MLNGTRAVPIASRTAFRRVGSCLKAESINRASAINNKVTAEPPDGLEAKQSSNSGAWTITITRA